MSRNKNKNTGMKEYDVPSSLSPRYVKEFIKLSFHLPTYSISKINFNFYLFKIMENQQLKFITKFND